MRKRGFIHNAFVGVLVILAGLSFATTAIAGWTHQTALVTDRFVGVVSSAIEQPQVATNLGERVADQIVTRLDLEQRLTNALPDKLDRLAIPVTDAVHDKIAQATTDLLANPNFQDRLTTLLGRLHTGFLNVVNGDSQYFTTTDGKLTLDLLAVIDTVISELQADGVLPTAADFPRFSAAADRTDFLARLSTYVDAQLPPDFGQVPIADASAIETIGTGLRLFDQALIGMVVLTLVLAIGAVLFADRRWNAVFWLGLTAEVVLGLLILGLLWARTYSGTVVSNPDSPVLAGALVGALASSLALWLAALGVVILMITIPAALLARRSRNDVPPSAAAPVAAKA
jgi:hypothetical protein